MLTVILCSVLAGVLLTLAAQALWLRRQFGRLPVLPIPKRPQYDRYRLPQSLQKLLTDMASTKKESCFSLNMLLQFLFREVKDTKEMRRWVIKKMNIEFEDMLQTTSGKLLDQIVVRDFNFGTMFPIIQSATVKKVHTEDEAIEELDVVLDLDYSGGFQLAIDADLVFGKSGYLSVRVTKLKGQARLLMSRQPYTHWSFAFLEEPQMEFDVESKFEGRPIPQITSLIINQIKRSIRKKHTLPNYKIRYRPFFVQPAPFASIKDLYLHGNKVGLGQMDLTIIECSRLKAMPADCKMYCTLALDTSPWRELENSRDQIWVTYNIEIIRSQGQPVGLTFKEEYSLEKYEDVVVIETITADLPAGQTDIKKNDVIISIGNTRVTSCKQAVRLIKNAAERFNVRVERPQLKTSLGGDVKVNDDSLSLKDFDPDSRSDDIAMNGDDFFHVSYKAGENKEVTHPSEEGDGKTPQKKSLPFIGAATQMFHKRRHKGSPPDGLSTGSKESPELARKVDDAADDSKGEIKHSPKRDAPIRKGRTNSDISMTSKISIDDRSDGASFNILAMDELEDSEDENDDIRKSKMVPAAQDPIWNEKFKLDFEEHHKYVNVCVWCHVPQKLDKNERIIKKEKEVLMGHISLSITDIALECLTTLQGDAQRTVNLVSAEAKAGASRSKYSNTNLTGHIGFNPALCFGDITIAFHYHPVRGFAPLRKKLTKLLIEPEETTMQDSADKQSMSDDRPKRPEDGYHDFVRTQFTSSTYCKFCGKKIWLKTAFQCNSCSMICHKKCTEKCQAQTLCTKDGVKVRENPSEIWKPPVSHIEPDKKKSTEEHVSKSGGLLSKFRKDSNSKKGGGSPGKSPRESPVLTRKSPSPQLPIRRLNSAPDDISSDEEAATSLLLVKGFPRTRSTTALQSLVDQNASPFLQPDELKPSTDLSSEESDDSDSDVYNQASNFKSPPIGHHMDEVIVMAAKEMGRELFSHLAIEERRVKLDEMVSKLQQEIDEESDSKSELVRLEQECTDISTKKVLIEKIMNSDEKIEALMMLMLHYCAGLQHCLDQQEAEKSSPEDATEALAFDLSYDQPFRSSQEEQEELLNASNELQFNANII